MNAPPNVISMGLEKYLPATPADLLSQLFTDTGNAERFILRCGDTARYCFQMKKWLLFDGMRWRVSDAEEERILVKRVFVDMMQQAIDRNNEAAEKFARRSLESKRISNALREAQSTLAVSPDDLDRDAYLLNFLNGTVDLRTGGLQPHDAADFLTKLVHYNYDPDARCDLFLGMLARLMGRIAESSVLECERAERMVSTIQKCLGYSVTACTSEKTVFVLHGSGNNGKTTLLAMVLNLIPEYAVLLQIDTLMVRHESSNSQADLADLRGARFVMTSETEEGQRLSEGKLKRIAQGMGRIKAVRKYENPIEFPETHKLWIDANHKPVIRGTDAAIWNRLYLIPFTVTLDRSEIDRELPQKLMKEAEGILAWIVAGAVHWVKRVSTVQRK